MSNSIIARLGLDSKDFKTAIAGVKSHLFGVKSELMQTFAGAMTLGAVAQFGRAILDFAGNLQDASDALGINVEALQELQGAFGQSGANAEVVNKGLAKLSENLTAARDGNEAMIASFEKLGVSWKEINTLSPDQILTRIAASAGDARDPAERLALIMDVMGKSGRKMAAGLNGGADALARMREEASKLSAEDIAAIDEAGDAISRLENKAKVLGSQTILGKAPEWLKQLSPLAQVIGLGRSAADKIAPKDFPAGYRPTPGMTVPESAAEPGAPIRTDKGIEDNMAKEAKAHAERMKHADEEADLARGTAMQMGEEAAKFLEQREKDAKELRDFEKAQSDDYFDHREKAAAELLEKEKDHADTLAAYAERTYKASLDKIANRREQFIDDQKNPGAAAERRREAKRDERAGRKFDRMEALRQRGGKAQQDVAPGPGDSDFIGPLEPLLPREARAREAREGLAAGRKGGETDFAGQMDSTQMAKDIAAMKEKLGTNL